MEDLRVEHIDYVWKFGLNPFQEDNKNDEKESKEIDADGGGGGICEGSGETNVYNNGNYGGNQHCAFNGCKLKAMALTTYCKLHILSDKKQQLYKPCDYVIKRFHFYNAAFFLFFLIIDELGLFGLFGNEYYLIGAYFW